MDHDHCHAVFDRNTPGNARSARQRELASQAATTCTPQELGLFTTHILTPDNVSTILGNNKVFSDNIQNFSSQPVRRVDCVAKVANSVDVQDAIARAPGFGQGNGPLGH